MVNHVRPFELKVGGPDGIDNADVPVRWCITPEFITQMEKDGVVDPHIVLVSVHPRFGEMSRHIAPVGDLMTFVRFNRAGTMRLFGWIVDGKDGRKVLHRNFMQKTKGAWNTTLIDKWGNVGREDIDGTYIGTARNVEIPPDVFGKEPNPTVKWFVNLWHSDRLQDECHFRQRMILAFTLKWIPVLLWVATLVTFRLAASLMFVSIGWRQNVTWKNIFRPFKTTFSMTIDDDVQWKEHTFLWRKKLKDSNGNEVNHVFFGLLPFTPIFPLTMFGITYLTNELHPGFAAIETIGIMVIALVLLNLFDLLFLTVFWLILNNSRIRAKTLKIEKFMHEHHQIMVWILGSLAVVGISIVVALTWEISMWVLVFFASISAVYFVYIKVIDWMFENWSTDAEHNDPTAIRELLCPNDEMNWPAQYNMLPLEHRSKSVWFKTLKNRICKPMQM